jgi:hypothetical protein
VVGYRETSGTEEIHVVTGSWYRGIRRQRPGNLTGFSNVTTWGEQAVTSPIGGRSRHLAASRPAV